MPAILDLDSKQIIFRCEGDAECIREKYGLLHETPVRRLKLLGMHFCTDDDDGNDDDDYDFH